MVRPTSSKVRNVELQARAAEQVQRAIESPEFPGRVVAEIHGELIVEAPKFTEKESTTARAIIASQYQVPERMLFGDSESKDPNGTEAKQFIDTVLQATGVDHIDKAREFIAGIQAKDEGYRQRIQDSWVVREGPQYTHVTCGQFAVVVRIRQASWVRDQKELYCTHCKVVPHELHVDFESQNSGT